jgi:hypothetical protein
VRECRDIVFDKTRQYQPAEANHKVPRDIRRAVPYAVRE